MPTGIAGARRTCSLGWQVDGLAQPQNAPSAAPPPRTSSTTPNPLDPSTNLRRGRKTGPERRNMHGTASLGRIALEIPEQNTRVFGVRASRRLRNAMHAYIWPSCLRAKSRKAFVHTPLQHTFGGVAPSFWRHTDRSVRLSVNKIGERHPTTIPHCPRLPTNCLPTLPTLPSARSGVLRGRSAHWPSPSS